MEWKLQKIEIELERWGEHKGKYKGEIKYSNGEGDSFTFKLNEDQCCPFLPLIAEEIIKSASELGEKVASSLMMNSDGIGDN